MARSDRVVRRIDERNDNIRTGGGDLIQIGSAAPTMPGVIQPPEPTDVTIGTQVLLRTTYTPKVAVNVSWGAPPNLLPEFYLVEYAEDVDFTVNVIRITTSLNRIALEMKPDTDYWVRVKAMIRNMYSDWGYPSNYPTVSVHTIGDTTPPNAVSGVTANWTTGDLILKWTNPSNDNFFQTRVRIYNTFGGTLYKEVFIVGNPGSKSEYRFTVDENYDVTGNNPLTTVYYEILAYSLVGVPAVTAVTGTITKAKPSIPAGLSSSWSGDDGTYDETVTFTWSAVVGASIYRIIIDGVIKETPRTQYTYSYSENVSDHRPTLVSGDYALAFTVQAKDALGQISPGASGTATNIAPQADNLALTVIPGFSSLYAYISPDNEILDLYAYNWTLKSGGVNVRQVVTFTPEVTFTTLNGLYDLHVYAIDKFGQRSATLSGFFTLDGLTIEQLRSEGTYTDSLGTANLNGLKDNNLVQSVRTYPSGVWNWIRYERPLIDRYRTLTIAASGVPLNPSVYVRTSDDGDTWTYFSGPLTGTYANTLTEQADQTAAEANVFTWHASLTRYDLPTITEARFVELIFKHNNLPIHMAEYYPRRLVQSDDVETEGLKAINIAANAITADKISVISLAAITIWTGALTVSGVISIHTAGGIYQGTGTFASPTTGLKIYNTSGIGRLTTYSGGTAQIDFDSIGRLTAGAGAVRLDKDGVQITGGSFTFALTNISPVVPPRVNTVEWLKTSGAGSQNAGIVGSTTGQALILGERVTLAVPYSSTDSIGIDVQGSSGAVRIEADEVVVGIGGIATSFKITPNSSSGASSFTEVYGRLDVGVPDTTSGSRGIRAFGAITSEDALQSIMEDSATNTLTGNLSLQHLSTGTPAANFGSAISFQLHSSNNTLRNAAQIYGEWTVATDASRQGRLRLIAADSVGGREGFRVTANGSAVALGFFGSAGGARPNITGVRTGTLAQLQTVMANFLAGLAGLGLITDSTT